MWNGIGWYGCIGVIISTSTTDISLSVSMPNDILNKVL